MFNSSSQSFLEFEDIRDGVMVLRNKGLRGTLLVSSVNFGLKSEEEQKAIIFQFQSFLNSLDFSTQIIIQSRKLNITGYFDKLKEMEVQQTKELLKLQTREYRKFVEGLVKEGTIMKKEFYVVVPFTTSEAVGMSMSNLMPKFGTKDREYYGFGKDGFERLKEQLWQRMEFVAIGLRRCDLTAVPLTTPEIIETFWALHHPKESEFGYYPEILPEVIK